MTRAARAEGGDVCPVAVPLCAACGSGSAALQRVFDTGQPSDMCPRCLKKLIASSRQARHGSGKGQQKSGWGKAKSTDVGGIRFPSRLEARVYQRLRDEVAATPGARLYRQVRFPLFALAPGERLVPLYITVDFVIRDEAGSIRAIDAKPKRWKSREWRRGRAALEATLGVQVEEVQE